MDERILAERARAWGLTGVMFAMLSAMRQLGAASVSDTLIAAFDPGPLRRAVLRDAAARGPAAPGLGWVVGQLPLRDDPLAWAAGVGGYAVARARDRGWFERPGGRGGAYRVPLWVRGVLAVDRAFERVGNVVGVRDEALLALVPPEERGALTAAMYAELPSYLPGGSRFRTDLFGWEERVLASPEFPRAGRILLGGAGPGRELAALVERGFEVVAFDPCLPFTEAARSLVPRDRAEVVCASYDDLVAAVAGRGGPLGPSVARAPFDAIVLGWGSLSHVMPAASRLELFRALRRLAPRAPVLASFLLVSDPAHLGPGKQRFRDGLRRAFATLGAPGRSEKNDHFLARAGFFSYLTPGEVARLAKDSGYEVSILDESPYPHALLVPVGLTGGPKSP